MTSCTQCNENNCKMNIDRIGFNATTVAVLGAGATRGAEFVKDSTTILFADILRARACGIRQATDYDYDHEHEDQGPAPPLYLSHMLVGAIPRVTVLLLFHFWRHDAIVIAVQITIFVKSRLC